MSTEKRPYVRTLKAYVVIDSDGNERLVRAYTPMEAIRHCTPTFGVHLATHDDIITLMASGVMVETVGLPEAAPADESAGLAD